MASFYEATRRTGVDDVVLDSFDRINKVFPEQTLFPAAGFDLDGLLDRMDEVAMCLRLIEVVDEWTPILESGNGRFTNIPELLTNPTRLAAKASSRFPEVRVAATKRLEATKSSEEDR